MLFDIRIIDTDALCHIPEAVLKVQQKKRKGRIRKQFKIDVVNLPPLLFQLTDSNHFIEHIAASLAIKIQMGEVLLENGQNQAIICNLASVCEASRVISYAALHNRLIARGAKCAIGMVNKISIKNDICTHMQHANMYS